MSDATPLLDRRAIEDAFRKLGDRLANRGVSLATQLVAQRAGKRLRRDWRGPRGTARVRPSGASCRGGIRRAPLSDEGPGRSEA